MNLDSARNRIKILEGLAARITSRCIYAQHLPITAEIANDSETILRQCEFLALDLKYAEIQEQVRAAMERKE